MLHILTWEYSVYPSLKGVTRVEAKRNYILQAIFAETVILPLMTCVCYGAGKVIAVLLIDATDHALPQYFYSTFQNLNVFTFAPAAYIGFRLAKDRNLPDDLFSRYWPLIMPIFALLAWGVVIDIFAYDGRHSSSALALPIFSFCLPYLLVSVVSFGVSCRLLGKQANPAKRGFHLAVSAALLATVALPFALAMHLAKTDADNKLSGQYNGSAVVEEIDRFEYSLDGSDSPLTGRKNRLSRLEEPSSLIISEDYPRIDGATAFIPIYTSAAGEVYRGEGREKYIAFSKTAEAYKRLISGDADVIFVLQPSDGQMQAAKDAGRELRLTPVAKEAFVFFVNRSNPVSGLSAAQIRDIYRKKIKNWRDAGGSDMRIIPFQRPKDSGSQTTMIKDVMNGQELPKPLQGEFSRGMGTIIRDVAIYRDYAEAIGYSFLFFTNHMVKYEARMDRDYDRIPVPNYLLNHTEDRVKLLSVDGVEPTAENIRRGRYPFVSEIYAVTAGTKNPNAQKLIDWLLSPQGQGLIEKTGYVGVK
jgi:phosphate transport system substrate-binding protein